MCYLVVCIPSITNTHYAIVFTIKFWFKQFHLFLHPSKLHAILLKTISPLSLLTFAVLCPIDFLLR